MDIPDAGYADRYGFFGDSLLSPCSAASLVTRSHAAEAGRLDTIISKTMNHETAPSGDWARNIARAIENAGRSGENPIQAFPLSGASALELRR